MTREERRTLLGDAVYSAAERQGRAAATTAPPSPELLARLRLILTRPAGRPASGVRRPAA
jgi:hypothetical protein